MFKHDKKTNPQPTNQFFILRRDSEPQSWGKTISGNDLSIFVSFKD